GPAVVLTEPALPRQCWPIRGQRVRLGIVLSHPGLVNSIGIEHSTKDILENNSNAPNKFLAWSVAESRKIGSPLLLGTFIFNPSLSYQVQNFTMTSSEEVTEVLILNFIGGMEKRREMCLYGVRVYGQ
ncbi:hypothetical protein CPB86DRAFT_685713, partial [Serendipita vermifera]